MAKKVDNFVLASDVNISDLQEAMRPYPRVQKVFNKPSLTRQSEMASTDLHGLVRRYGMSGGIPPSSLRFGDVTGLPESRLEAFERIQQAKEAFDALPLKVRQAVGHDSRRLEDWIVANPELARELLNDHMEPVQPAVPKPSPANPTSSGGAGEGKSGEPA